jgi:hypothetical protein
MVTMEIFTLKEKFPWQNRESNPGPHDIADRSSDHLTTSWLVITANTDV